MFPSQNNRNQNTCCRKNGLSCIQQDQGSGEPDYAGHEENVYEDAPAVNDGNTELTAIALYDYQAGMFCHFYHPWSKEIIHLVASGFLSI